MSEKNKQIVEKVNESFLAGSTDGFLDNASDDIVWTMVGEKTSKGKTEIREWMKSMEGMEPPKFTVDQIIAEGDSVVCIGDMKMKDEAGLEGQYSYVDAYKFSGDKIVELKSFIVKHKSEEESKKKAA